MEVVTETKCEYPLLETWRSPENNLVRIKVYLDNGIRLLFSVALVELPAQHELQMLKDDLEMQFSKETVSSEISRFTAKIFHLVRDPFSSCHIYLDKVDPDVRHDIITSVNYRMLMRATGQSKMSTQF